MSTRPVIAVVDDEELFRTWLSEHLGAAGYAVIEAVTGRDALRLAAEQNPALMLLDLRLPDADGLELVTRLHEADREDEFGGVGPGKEKAAKVHSCQSGSQGWETHGRPHQKGTSWSCHANDSGQRDCCAPQG